MAERVSPFHETYVGVRIQILHAGNDWNASRFRVTWDRGSSASGETIYATIT